MDQLVKIGIIGDYNANFRPHHSVKEALNRASEALSARLEIVWAPTLEIEADRSDLQLRSFDALWCSPGSPYKSLEGALRAVRFAREQGWPFIGTCAGFQHAVLEYARNVLGVKNAAHAEYDPDPNASTLFLVPLACSPAGQTLKVKVKPDTRAHRAYGQDEINELYYCRYGLNPEFQRDIDEGGLKIVGVDDEGEARILEIPEHRFFITTLFVPENPAASKEGSQSAPYHPLIKAYLQAAIAFKAERLSNAAPA